MSAPMYRISLIHEKTVSILNSHLKVYGLPNQSNLSLALIHQISSTNY